MIFFNLLFQKYKIILLILFLLRKDLSTNYLNLNDIFNDVDVCPFLKKILRKFMDCKRIKEKDLLININFYSKKNPEIPGEKQGDNGEILIDPDFEEIFPRSCYRDYNP